MSKGIAPAKIIISGEHFVVENKPALVCAINLYSEVYVEERYDEYFRIESKNEKITHVIKADYKGKILDYAGNKKTKKFLFPVLKAVKKTFELSNKKFGKDIKKGFDIIINSEIPYSAGLGSSATVAVATSAAILKEITGKVDKDLVWKAAFEAERIIHKMPSGIDITAATYGGIFQFKKGSNPVFLKLENFKGKFLVAYLGKRSQTGKIVEDVLRLKNEFPTVINPLYVSAEYITNLIINSLLNNDLINAGRLMYINHELLSAIGTSNSKIDFLINLAKKKGAYGAKLTGAGRGGCIIALVDEKNLEKVKSAWSKHSKKIFLTEIDTEGVRAY